MTIRDVMMKQNAVCRWETNLAEASAMMWESNCGALPVLAETGELAAVLTDRDICIALGTRNVHASDLTVRDVIETAPLMCTATDDIRSALQIMQETKVRRLPVVNQRGELEGMVSIDDILMSVLRDDDHISNQRPAA